MRHLVSFARLQCLCITDSTMNSLSPLFFLDVHVLGGLLALVECIATVGSLLVDVRAQWMVELVSTYAAFSPPDLMPPVSPPAMTRGVVEMKRRVDRVSVVRSIVDVGVWIDRRG